MQPPASHRGKWTRYFQASERWVVWDGQLPNCLSGATKHTLTQIMTTTETVTHTHTHKLKTTRINHTQEQKTFSKCTARICLLHKKDATCLTSFRSDTASQAADTHNYAHTAHALNGCLQGEEFFYQRRYVDNIMPPENWKNVNKCWIELQQSLRIPEIFLFCQG